MNFLFSKTYIIHSLENNTKDILYIQIGTTETGVEIIVPPKSQSVELYTEVVFTCEVSGDRRPNMYWYRNGEPLSASWLYVVSNITDGSMLKLVEVWERDDGSNFTCVVETDQGETLEATAHLSAFSEGRGEFAHHQLLRRVAERQSNYFHKCSL